MFSAESASEIIFENRSVVEAFVIKEPGVGLLFGRPCACVCV